MSDVRTAQIQSEQLRTYFREASDQAVSGCVAIALFGYLAAQSVPVWLATAPVAAIWLLTTDLWRASRRPDIAAAHRFDYWNRRQTWLGALAGGCWGTMAVAVIVSGDENAQFMALMLTAIVATVSAGDGAALIRPTLGFVLSCLVPPTLALLVHGDTLHWILLAMMGVLIQVNVVQIRKRHRAFLTLQAARADMAAMTDDLIRARDRAEAASQAKTAFLANISHELRTPLNAILGATYLLESGAGKTATRLGQIRDAGKHLLSIINQVLDLARQEAGGLILDDQPLDAARIVRDAVDMIRPEAERKGLALSVTIDGAPAPLLRGDPVRLRQAVLNLLANAVKFTERGGIELHARHLPAAAGQHTVRVDVVDTGIGISPKVLPRLFHAFEQADPGIARRYGGSGLGLALTRQLVEAMDGTVGVESQPGQGSRFWLTVTLAADLAPADAGAASPAQPGTAAAAAAAAEAETAATREAARRLRDAANGRAFLVVDDSPINRELLVCILESAGLAVEAAVDGDEAVRRAAAADYAAILMDVQMPGMDGLAATRAIRRQPGGAAVPILAVSASVFDEDRASCVAAGMNELLGKPVAPAELFGTLLHYLPA